MHRSRRPRQSPGVSFGLLALVAAACGGGALATPEGSAIVVPSVSFVPAQETSTPEPVEAPDELPPIAPPSNVPPPPSLPGPDYAGSPDDLAAFASAYREALQVPDLADEEITAAGARLCSYLQRHAGADGVVDVERALTEAEINEPGYPREAWLVAFELASTFFCSELSFDADDGGS